MNFLHNEILEYIKELYADSNITLSDIQNSTISYTKFTNGLIPDTIPKDMVKYLNIPHMVHDLYSNEHILVFRCNTNDDNDTFISTADYDEPEHTMGFINGVKLLDDFEIREQITANEYTGGYWDEMIHWILDLRKLQMK